MTTGRCHICKATKTITFCGACGHWFCYICKAKWLGRLKEAVREFLDPSLKPCCGPEGQ